ncbi:MAG TPA: zinc-dependent metalloprotease [Blastocatellia bacterium]
MRKISIASLSVLVLGVMLYAGPWLLSHFIGYGYSVAHADDQAQLQGQQGQEPAQDQRPAEGPPARFGRPDAGHEIKPYDKVITRDAKSEPGIFTVHKIKEKVYYEIPATELGKDFLLVSTIARTTLGVGYGGQFLGDQVIRWERHDDKVLLEKVSYDVVADEHLPISMAVDAANNKSILMSFYIDALGKGEAPVIEVTRLFNTEVPEISARARLRARGFDPSRSFIERVQAFPQNIEVEATHTFTSPIEPPTLQAGTPTPQNPFFGQGMRPGSATVLMHYSMVKLPEQKMMPRLFDERVGYFSVKQQDYGQNEHQAPERHYITRWRLEKKDPNAALSEPVKPIIYYIDPATPTKWVPYLKRGIESWQVAFEAAGFKNAIIAKEAPTKEQDPTWSPDDVRNSVVRWLPSTVENAVGPHISDPRTGEILNADIQFYHNVMKLARDWYITQVGPLDPRAQKLPIPDELEGRLLEYVVTHEVGHTLGFQHNMKASSLYDADKIHDREFVKKMGHTPTLMDYARFNYVAQPEDKIDPEDLVPKIGPYDIWATMWGYKPIPEAGTPDDEKKTLDTWAREQDTKPWLRFSVPGALGADPGDNTEAVGDADAVKSTGYGMKNLRRVTDMLITIASEPGKPYDDLADLYEHVLVQWQLELGHVAVIVGGVESQEKYAGQNGVLFTPESKERQIAAVNFLNQNAFATPTWAVKPEILERIEPSGVMQRIRVIQQRVLGMELATQRLGRLIEQEALDGNAAYSPSEFLADVRHGIWSELSAAQVRVDPFRRNTQDVYLDLFAEKLNGPLPVPDDQRALIRGELRTLSHDIAKALLRTTDRETRYHLEDARDQIAKALDPKFATPAPTGRAGLILRAESGDDSDSLDPSDVHTPFNCWPDYSIRLPEKQ